MSKEIDRTLNVVRLVAIEEEQWFPRQMPKGQREKYELRTDPDNSPSGKDGTWYWKASVPRFPLEFWSEVLAYCIGAAVGVQCPLTLPALYRDKWGSLSASMLGGGPHSPTLIHGGDILAALDPTYDRDKGTNQTVQLIYKVLDSPLFMSWPADAASLIIYRVPESPPPSRLLNQAPFLRTLLFDALIGNQDRHHENWGLIVQRRGAGGLVFELTPAFDNGSSLLRELRDDDEITSKVGAMQDLDRYVRKAESEIRWQGVPKRLTHLEFLRRHFEQYPWSREAAAAFLGYNRDDVATAVQHVARISQDVERLEISSLRADKIVETIDRRRRLIEDLL